MLSMGLCQTPAPPCPQFRSLAHNGAKTCELKEAFCLLVDYILFMVIYLINCSGGKKANTFTLFHNHITIDIRK